MPVVCMYIHMYLHFYVCMYVHVLVSVSIEEQAKNLLTHTITTTLLDLPACLWLRASSLRERESVDCERDWARERCWGQLSVSFAPRFSVLFYSPALQVDFHGLQPTCTHTYIHTSYIHIQMCSCMYVYYICFLIRLGQKSALSFGVFLVSGTKIIKTTTAAEATTTTIKSNIKNTF